MTVLVLGAGIVGLSCALLSCMDMMSEAETLHLRNGL